MTTLRTIINEELGYVSALFMSKSCKGTEIIMPTEELIKVSDRLSLAISNALVEALEEQKYTADQGIDAEMGSHNEALTKAQNIIKELLKSKN